MSLAHGTLEQPEQRRQCLLRCRLYGPQSAPMSLGLSSQCLPISGVPFQPAHQSLVPTEPSSGCDYKLDQTQATALRPLRYL